MTTVDVTGQKFGRLTAIEAIGRDARGSRLWRCSCDCGSETTVRASSLRAGSVKSCGCSRRRDLAGQKFGRLTVLREAEPICGRTAYLCACVCGNEKVVRRASLKNGDAKTCGCGPHGGRPTHGQHKTALHSRWAGMIQRTSNPNRGVVYHNYGGRGIVVDERWKSFENFAADMGPTFSPELTLDRINVNGPYSPDNCRWATPTEQARNTRRNRFLTFRGHTKSLAEWCELLGLNYGSTKSRLLRGWPVERALTEGLDGETCDVFYIVVNDASATVKPGITSDPRDRLGAHRREGFGRLVRLFEGLPLGVALEVELLVFEALKEAGEEPERGREYFPLHALGLILAVVDDHPRLQAHMERSAP